MDLRSGAPARLLAKLPDRPRAPAHGCEPGPVTDRLEHAVSPPVEPLVAQGLAVAGALTDSQPAISTQLGVGAETARILHGGPKEGRSNEPDSRHLSHASHLGKPPSRFPQVTQRQLLHPQRTLQPFVKQLDRPPGLLGQLLEGLIGFIRMNEFTVL